LVARQLLAAANVWSLPEAIRRELQVTCWRETAFAHVLLEIQLRLAAELDRADIPALWLKGLALSEQLYGHFAVRGCGDLDLLVEPTHIPQVEELLGRLGFDRYHSPVPGQEEHFHGSQHTTWQMHRAGESRVLLELHHRLGGPAVCQPPTGAIVKRRRRIPLAGSSVWVPSLEDELLMLCLHAHQHNFGLLRPLLDIAGYIERYRHFLDWSRLLAKARQSRCLARTRAGLLLATSLWQLARDRIPAPLLNLKPVQHWALHGLTPAVLFRAELQHDQFWRLRLALLMDRWDDGVRLIGPLVFPPVRYVQARCPDAWKRLPGFAHFYYLARFSGISARKLVRQLSDDRATEDRVAFEPRY
jgi:hypothetical protein